MTTQPIPVISDRRRAEGVAGEEAFADFGDLLDFEPVPLQVDRVDGFSPEAQRAFIAALSILGSADRAAKAIGNSATGAERLRKLPGSEGFRRAWKRAKEMSLQKGRLRLADSLRAVAHPEPPPPPPAEPEEEMDPALRDRANRDFVLILLKKHELKLIQERRARLEGRVVEADFYLRQITWLEVAIDLGTGDGFAVFADLRRGRYDLVEIVETPMSRLFGAARRARWREAGEPDRPECPTGQRLRDHGWFVTQDGESWSSGTDPRSFAEWDSAIAAEHEAAAAAQAEWEEKSRTDAEAWRARLEAEDPAGEGEGQGTGAGEAGGAAEPGPSGDGEEGV
ncbi:MAG TPA: hypothetical protein VFZ91_13600 [Allosphingosinicella sp.]